MKMTKQSHRALVSVVIILTSLWAAATTRAQTRSPMTNTNLWLGSYRSRDATTWYTFEISRAKYDSLPDWTNNSPRTSFELFRFRQSIDGLQQATSGSPGRPVEFTRADGPGDWTSAIAGIPLQPQRATQLALARCRFLYPKATALSAIEFQLRPCGERPNKWMYLITIASDGDGQVPTGMFVLLDGTVVDPVVDPEHLYAPDPKPPRNTPVNGKLSTSEMDAIIKRLLEKRSTESDPTNDHPRPDPSYLPPPAR